uniref:Zinc finger protein RFP-like n=1 Tax=Pelusios castaneus TaxID=367368 RepID=A0A8C8VM16_9SAUR
MAAASPAKTLQEETTCPICREYFTDPVSLDCDHNFCRACITQHWDGSQTASSRGLRLESVKKAETEGLCEKHREPLKLFCKDDQIPICLVCDKSKEHRDHTVIPAEEAKNIQAHLKTLREEREELLECKVSREKRNQENLRQKIVSEFQKLRQFLEEQERLLLAQLEKLDKEMVKFQTENINKLSAEISRLSELISELEGKCQKPVNDFLQVRVTLNTWVWESSSQNLSVTQRVCSSHVNLYCSLQSDRYLVIMTVTLDPDTAHPQLVLSEDGKRVRWGHTWQDLLDTPERFDTALCVLGREGFTSGRHCWEVDVGDGRYWGVGVARESMRRKGEISRSPEEGIWAVVRWWDQIWALTSPVTPLPQSRVPSRIRVCLDCDRGQVTFFGADDEAPIFTFPPGSVPGERIQPWLWVWDRDTRLRLCP